MTRGGAAREALLDYPITVLTLSQPIPVGTLGAARFEPWVGKIGPLAMPDATLSTITLSDGDGKLDNIYAAKSAGVIESEQRLTAPATFGSGSAQTTLASGTQLSFAYGSIIQDSDGNRFIVSFPNSGTTSVNGTIVGGYTSVLVMPLPKTDASGAIVTDASGNPVYPAFDLTKTFTYAGKQNFSGTNYGITYSYPTAVDCFAEGTLIETAFGARRVETLREGDMIRTRDNGLRWLSWIGSVHLDAARLDLAPNLRPVRIAAGALGAGLPARDLILSPQHRVLVRSAIAQRMFGETEILVAIKHLLGLPGIEAICPEGGVTYWHILFDGHELVQANGAWAESLYLGRQALAGLSEAGRREVMALFPGLDHDAPAPAGARRFLTGREGRKLAERLGRKGRHPVETA